MQKSIFQPYLSSTAIFKKDRNILQHSYVPTELPHRDREINQLASILALSLKGERPSNVLIFGKTGTGKTAVAKYLGMEFEKLRSYPVRLAGVLPEGSSGADHATGHTSETEAGAARGARAGPVAADEPEDPMPGLSEGARGVDYLYVNCQIIDTNYGILYTIGNSFVTTWAEKIPFTGWPMETLYSRVRDTLDQQKRVVILVLDEIDKLIYNSGDDVLYYLLKLNEDLKNAKVTIIGISNETKFAEFLDPRVQSRLGEVKLVFRPYDADQLRDILEQRASLAFEDGVISPEVIALCAAQAAKEHGDARRALALLRVAAELAERDGREIITEDYVQRAKNQIELDCTQEIIRSLPLQSKLALLGIVVTQERGSEKMTTGEAYDVYKALCKKVGTKPVTQRMFTDYISELDMLGIINVRLISKGRYGRTREISLAVSNVEARKVIEEDQTLAGLGLPLMAGQTTIF